MLTPAEMGSGNKKETHAKAARLASSTLPMKEATDSLTAASADLFTEPGSKRVKFENDLWTTSLEHSSPSTTLTEAASVIKLGQAAVEEGFRS